MSILSNYKIIKELGHGMFATVYMISVSKIKTKTKYALKIERIEKKDIKPNSKSQVWREINFCTKIASKYPEQFVQLVEYDFIENCTHIQKYSFDPKLFSRSKQNKLDKLAKSNYCIRKVFELIDGDLHQISNKLSLKQIYSMVIQITWAIYLIHSNGYAHADLHDRNIGWVKTAENKHLLIDKLNLPTFGYNFKLLDFGLVVGKSDLKTKTE